MVVWWRQTFCVVIIVCLYVSSASFPTSSLLCLCPFHVCIVDSRDFCSLDLPTTSSGSKAFSFFSPLIIHFCGMKRFAYCIPPKFLFFRSLRSMSYLLSSTMPPPLHLLLSLPLLLHVWTSNGVLIPFFFKRLLERKREVTKTGNFYFGAALRIHLLFFYIISDILRSKRKDRTGRNKSGISHETA